MEIVENNHNVVKAKLFLVITQAKKDVYEEDYSLKINEFNYLEMFPDYANGDTI